MIIELIVLIVFFIIFILPGFTLTRDDEVGIVTKKMLGQNNPPKTEQKK
jgi:uncharacterized protein YneF (UPF0154 family)